ncbi:MAG: putative Membrane protein [Xanthobacteraceae bacterium]|nr:putative Membrane protein [Xanthobacteraceae bacterium]
MLRVPVTPHDHIAGSQNAPVTLVEYGDYECPACGLAYPNVLRVQAYFDERLRFVFRHFPLQQIHPNAEPAAECAEFAGAHDRFWEMHEGLYENQDRLGLPLFLTLAGLLELPQADLRNALASGQYEPKVRADFVSGVRSGVNGTPTFFVNGHRHDGSFSFEELAAAISVRLRVTAPL